MQATAVTAEPKMVQGSLSIKRLAQVRIFTSNSNSNTELQHTLRNEYLGKQRAFISVGSLSQHYLGEAAVILPEVYRHSFVEEVELEPVLRLCLLDPSFPALVEKVEGELRKLREE